jgi:micrococcal nuclease
MPRIFTRAATAAVALLAISASACSADDITTTPAAHSTPQDLCDLGSCTTGTVDRTVDGDTLDVTTSDGQTQRVRVLGIDTPETKKPNTPVECMGPEASQATANLAQPGAQVTLVTDEKADSTDKYDRLLRHVLVDDEQTSLGRVLLDDGLAETTSFDHSLVDDYAAAEDAARSADTGLWGNC